MPTRTGLPYRLGESSGSISESSMSGSANPEFSELLKQIAELNGQVGNLAQESRATNERLTRLERAHVATPPPQGQGHGHIVHRAPPQPVHDPPIFGGEFEISRYVRGELPTLTLQELTDEIRKKCLVPITEQKFIREETVNKPVGLIESNSDKEFQHTKIDKSCTSVPSETTLIIPQATPLITKFTNVIPEIVSEIETQRLLNSLS
ncbi:uncharacterized protein LOC109842403 [Asparagus officinalis]|uniref:uncharacterized protein LOC109842403 n=1 Tax=Asparagus officinalis TaxID=4686 RepID=UPI00098E360F|nr:uncharacterized protein LOC109842403 [Asparagus officinalis]